MKRSQFLEGIICPMVTPFDATGQVDLDASCHVVDFLLEHKIDGLMVGGTTGEGASLTSQERKDLLETVVKRVDGRAPVIAHTGSITTAETIALTQHAQSAGATATSAIVPYFYTFDDESLFQHYVAVAQSVPELPLLLYMFPGNAKNDISPALLGRLLDATDNIAGFKSSNSDMVIFQEYIRAGGSDFTAICGSDGMMYAALALGSHGQISGNANVFPELSKALYTAFRNGDTKQAYQLQRNLDHVRQVLGDGLHPAYFKAGLKFRGVDAGYVRSPMRELTPAESELLDMQIRQFDPLNWKP